MSNSTIITITPDNAVLAERTASGLAVQYVAVQDVRPATFGEAETFLAEHGYALAGSWELSDAGVQATVRKIDNEFNGVRAVRLAEKVGTTHDDFVQMSARRVNNGDLISDLELCGIAVVAASSIDGANVKVHQVTEGKSWDERYTGHFGLNRQVMVARKR